MSNRIIMRAGYSPVTKWHSVQVQRQCVMSGACHFIITSHWILPSSVSLSVCSSDSSAVPDGAWGRTFSASNMKCARCLHVLSHSKLKRQEIFGKNSSIFTHHLPHTPDSLSIFYLFLFYLFIFHFNTKKQLFMFYECSINMQKKNLKLINRIIIIICLSQNKLLSYIYISLYQPRWAMSALDGTTTTTHRRPCDKGGCSVSPPPPCFSLISCEGAKKHSVEIAMATGVRGAGLYWPITHLRPVAYCFSNIHFNSRHPAQSGIWLKSEFASHWSYCWFSAYLLSFLKHV